MVTALNRKNLCMFIYNLQGDVQYITMRLFNMLVHAAPIGKNPAAIGAGKLFAKVQRITVRLQVTLPRKVLPAV